MGSTAGKMYSVSDMVDEAIERYGLTQVDETVRNNWMTEIRRILQDTLKCWDNADTEVRPGSPDTKVFPRSVMMQVFDSTRGEKYFMGAANKSEIFEENKRLDSLADELSQAEIDGQSRQTMGNDDLPPIGLDAIRRIKHDMMLEALFNLFFTEFDEALLAEDLDAVELMDRSNQSREDARVQQRLKHPEGAYFHRKEDCKL